MIDQALKRWASPHQIDIIEAWEKTGSANKAAQSLGINVRGMRRSIERLKKKAAKEGHVTGNDRSKYVPEGFALSRRSTLIGQDGSVRAEWLISKPVAENAQNAIRDFCAELADGIKGIEPRSTEPEFVNDDLMTLYCLGDPHFGMYSWCKESGEDFDTDIAETLTLSAISRLVQSSPPSKVGFLLNIGDFFHADDTSNQTPAHKNQLDIDTRFHRVVQIGFRAILFAIRKLLTKHETVIAWMLPGNHDPHTSFMLSIALDAFFHNDDRVEINLSPSHYQYHRFGKVLIGATHGHGAKHSELPGIMAADVPKDWGESDHRHIFVGHIHHLTRIETPGCIVESLRTLAPKDAWHAQKGYRSGRDMQAIVYHRENGETERHTCNAAMAKSAMP